LRLPSGKQGDFSTAELSSANWTHPDHLPHSATPLSFKELFAFGQLRAFRRFALSRSPLDKPSRRLAIVTVGNIVLGRACICGLLSTRQKS